MIGRVVSKENMTSAYNQVLKNKGAAGIDSNSVDDLLPYLNQHWKSIKHRVETGNYQSHPVGRQSKHGLRMEPDTIGWLGGGL